MEQKLELISISGLKGAGKDTVGRLLVEEYGFQRLSFSDALKACVSAIFGYDRAMIDGLTEESRAWREEVDEWWTKELDMDRDFTPRDFLIEIGSSVMRKWHPQIWVLALKRQMMNMGGRIVLTDTRFLNELWMVRQLGGQIWGVHKKLPTWVKPFYEGVSQHWFDHSNLAWRDEACAANMNSREQRDFMQVCGELIMKRDLNEIAHESEWHHLLWTDYDRVFPNLGTIDDLYERVDRALYDLNIPWTELQR